MLVHGGRKALKKTSGGRSRKYNKRGGCGSCVLSPAPYEGVGTLAATEKYGSYAEPPTLFSSNQVGGMAYGFSDPKDVSTFAGNYFPPSSISASNLDPSRGGNNFMSGGSRRRRSGKRSSKRSSKRSRKSKRSSKRSRKSRSSRGGSRKSKKWRQRGCSAKK
jgi:hypothetical protein